MRFFVFNVSSNATWKHSADKMNRGFTEGKKRVVEVNSTLNIFMDSKNAKGRNLDIILSKLSFYS